MLHSASLDPVATPQRTYRRHDLPAVGCPSDGRPMAVHGRTGKTAPISLFLA